MKCLASGSFEVLIQIDEVNMNFSFPPLRLFSPLKATEMPISLIKNR